MKSPYSSNKEEVQAPVQPPQVPTPTNEVVQAGSADFTQKPAAEVGVDNSCQALLGKANELVSLLQSKNDQDPSHHLEQALYSAGQARDWVKSKIVRDNDKDKGTQIKESLDRTQPAAPATEVKPE